MRGYCEDATVAAGFGCSAPFLSGAHTFFCCMLYATYIIAMTVVMQYPTMLIGLASTCK